MTDTWKPPNPYTLDWHTEACKAYAEGRPNPPITDEPITSYLRASMKKNGEFVPVVYWYDRDEQMTLLCEVDGELYIGAKCQLPNGQTLAQFWPYASKRPITIDQYDHYMKHGRWPEMSDAVHEATNNPPDDNSSEALESQINSLEEEAKRLLANAPARNQEECNQASVLVGKLNEWFQYDGDREWLKNRTRMDARITPEVIQGHETYTKVGMSVLNSIKRCEIFKRLKQEYQKPFLVGLKRAAERVGEKMPVQHAVLGYPATKLSAQKKAKIINYELLHGDGDFLISDEAAKARQQWANAYVRKHKKAPPGCEVEEEDVAS